MAGGSTPWKFGWSSGNPSLPPPGAGVAQTASRCFSTSATAASQPPLASMSGPATNTGLRASWRARARSSRLSGSGPERPATVRATAFAAISGSASASQSSIGIDTNAGPRGGIAAWWIARASACGTSWARGGSWLHLTYGCGPRIASRFVRFASIVICARTCWPAVISRGALFACAFEIPPTALPTPGAVWRFTCVGRPRRLREAVRHSHHHELLQPEHVPEVLRVVLEHRQLGGARIAEDRGHPVGAE